MRLLLWWGMFTVAGVWLQNLVPGVDFLMPGIVICLQENLLVWGGWLVLLWILLQEGTGSLAFGAALLCYGGLVGFYIGLRCYFEPENIVFIVLLSTLLAFWHFILGIGLASLQDLSISSSTLLKESMVQLAVFPAVWLLGTLVYRKLFAR
jgi:hypothetical protein